MQLQGLASQSPGNCHAWLLQQVAAISVVSSFSSGIPVQVSVPQAQQSTHAPATFANASLANSCGLQRLHFESFETGALTAVSS